MSADIDPNTLNDIADLDDLLIAERVLHRPLAEHEAKTRDELRGRVASVLSCIEQFDHVAYDVAGLERDNRQYGDFPSRCYTPEGKAKRAAEYLWDRVLCTNQYVINPQPLQALAATAAVKHTFRYSFNILSVTDMSAGMQILIDADLVMIDQKGNVVPTDKSRLRSAVG